MRIVLLCRSLDVGGTERQLGILARGLQQRGNEVAVVVFYSGGSMESELRDSGISIVDLHKSGRWDVFPFFLRMLRTIWKLKPELVYSFLGTPNILATLLKPFFPKMRIVWGVRASNVDLSRYNWLIRLSYPVECWFSRFADLIICNSNAGLEYAATQGFPMKRMTVVPNGIDLTRFKPDDAARERIRSEWGVPECDVLVGVVARLDPMKDHATFLRAAAILAQERPDVRFVCVGDGPTAYKNELMQLVKDSGLEGRVKWTGTRLDVPEIANALDIAVSSSAYGEGFSNTIAEVMACGVPCVATDVGDSALIVSSQGEVVPPSNPEALCEGIRLMLKKIGPDLRNVTRISIVERFTNDAMVASTVEVLCRLD